MSISFTVVGNSGGTTVSAFIGGESYLASSWTHPHINTIVRLLQEGDESVVDLFDLNPAATLPKAAQRFEQLTNRLVLKGEVVYLDDEPAPQAISDAIVAHYNAGFDYAPLVAFLDRLADNPNSDSVDQLYPWLQAHPDAFTITPEGYLVAYKGVTEVSDGIGGLFHSISSGRALVNGEVKTGQIPQRLGDEVSMPRNKVQFDPKVGCSTGLHAGTWEYASNFGGGVVLEVQIDPADVVSVPHDCSAQKLRACRYTVTDILDAPHTTPILGYESDEDPDWWGEMDFEETYTFGW
ncbi:MAG: hypothetical protein LC650_00460 [Actinobacteria bacterium]|nr:hypothetical protein [Actinomycetota bacterium]